MNVESVPFARILDVQKVFDYLQIHTDEYILNLYNPIKILTPNEKTIDLTFLKKSCIERFIVHEGIELEIVLDNQLKIAVSLREEDYIGPEAFQISMKSGVIIVD